MRPAPRRRVISIPQLGGLGEVRRATHKPTFFCARLVHSPNEAAAICEVEVEKDNEKECRSLMATVFIPALEIRPELLRDVSGHVGRHKSSKLR